VPQPERTSRARTGQARLIRLVVISAVFVLVGVGMLLTGATANGLLVVVFFGMTLAVAAARWRAGPDGGLPLWAALLGCAVFTAICGVLLVAALARAADLSVGGWLFAVVCAVGVVFFGGGGVLLVVRRRTQPPREKCRRAVTSSRATTRSRRSRR
jgi:hypothetical protein